MDNKINKVQINRTTRWGIDKWGNKIKETSQMFNVRCDDPDEAVALYNELLDKFYAEEKAKKEAKSALPEK